MHAIAHAPSDRQRFGAIAGATAGGRHFLAALEGRASTQLLQRDEGLIDQGGPARHCYLVLQGCIRTVRLLEDGRRQVGEFLLPGDLLGIESHLAHAFGAEAVVPSAVRRLSRADVDARAASDLEFARQLNGAMTAQLRARMDRIVTLGQRTAGERIAEFLLAMADRLASPDGAAFELPMNRADIADYLGLTVETVSRALTCLGRSGGISVSRARIAIRDRDALLPADHRLH